MSVLSVKTVMSSHNLLLIFTNNKNKVSTVIHFLITKQKRNWFCQKLILDPNFLSAIKLIIKY